MKKLILALFIVALLGGVGYLGYLIYVNQSVKSVELIGSPQTLYLTGDKIDYEDAYIKVTYNNGNIKEISLDSSSVQISMFSTSDVRTGGNSHGTMNIVYKDNTFKVDYDVMQRGFYYVSSESTITSTSKEPVATGTYNTSNTPCAIYFDDGGKLLYYVKDWSDGGYTLYDGNYIDEYSYELVKDEIKITAGKDVFSIKAMYDADLRQTVYKADKYSVDDNGLQSSKNTRIFDYYKEGALLLNNDFKATLDFSKESRKDTATSVSEPALLIEVSGDGYNSGDYKVFLHLKFMANNNFLLNVYVRVFDQMFDDGGLNIEGGDGVVTTFTHVNYDCFGKSIQTPMSYKLV